MASYTIAPGERAAHAKTLVASTVDTVQFNHDAQSVEVVNLDAADRIYFTVDESAPTVGGAATYVVPAAIGASVTVQAPDGITPTVKLISAGTPTYSVTAGGVSRAAGAGGTISGTVTSTLQPAQGSLTDRSGTITAGGTSQQAMAANASRKYLFVQNVSAADLWIRFGSAAVADQPSIKIPPDSAFVQEASFVSTQALNIIGATTAQAFSAKEA